MTIKTIGNLKKIFKDINIFSNFSGNPFGKNINEGVELYNKNKCEYSENKFNNQDRSKSIVIKSEKLSFKILENTKWQNLVAENCIDTLTFNKNQKGSYYSCEMNYIEKISYSINENELEINL